MAMIELNLLSANVASMETDATGWTAGAATTLARVATGHVGSWSLGMTRTATSGTATATSTARIPVTVGATYIARVWAQVTTAVSSRQARVAITWYDALVGGSVVGSTVTSSPATLLSSMAWAGYAVAVAGAPVGAVSAGLTVTVSGMSAAEVVRVDDLEFGTASSLAGNVLPYSVSSVEMDTTGWAVVSNCTLLQAQPGVEGPNCLRVTSVASGTVATATVARYPVVAGQEYAGYATCVSSHVGTSATIDLEWWTASSGGTLLSTTTRTVALIATLWRGVSAMGTAPVGATHVRMVLKATTGAAGQSRYWDQMIVGPPAILVTAGSLLSWLDQSMEFGVTGWAAAANCTIEQSDAAVDESWDGSFAMKVVCAAAGQARVELASLVPVDPDTYYVVEQSHRSPSSGISWTDVDWFDASMTYIGHGGPDQDAVTPSTGWRFNRAGRLSPSGAAFARPVLLPQAVTPGHVFFIDAVTLIEGTPPYVLTVQEATASTRLIINELDTADTITVRRVHADGSRWPVRGYGGDLVDAAVPSPVMLVEDHEAPLGQPIRYEYMRAAGTTGTFTVTVPPPVNPSDVWLKDPGQPRRNRLVRGRALPSSARPARRALHEVIGRQHPIPISDVRGSSSGELLLWTTTLDEYAGLDYLLDTSSVLLLQTTPGMGLDQAYVSVGDVVANRVTDYAFEPRRLWTLPITIVDRPAGGLAGTAGWTVADVAADAATPTVAAVLADYATALDLMLGTKIGA